MLIRLILQIPGSASLWSSLKSGVCSFAWNTVFWYSKKSNNDVSEDSVLVLLLTFSHDTLVPFGFLLLTILSRMLLTFWSHVGKKIMVMYATSTLSNQGVCKPSFVAEDGRTCIGSTVCSATDRQTLFKDSITRSRIKWEPNVFKSLSYQFSKFQWYELRMSGQMAIQNYEDSGSKFPFHYSEFSFNSLGLTGANCVWSTVMY